MKTMIFMTELKKISGFQQMLFDLLKKKTTTYLMEKWYNHTWPTTVRNK